MDETMNSTLPRKGKENKSGGKASTENRTARFLLLTVVALSVGFFAGIRYQQSLPARSSPPPAVNHLPPALPVDQPIRPAPARFLPDTTHPDGKEFVVCGPIDLATFSSGRDLIYFDDPRVWFASDHAGNHEDDDHTIHRSLEESLRRLVELAARRHAHIKIHGAYRPIGIHLIRSLHREGRAVDLTSEELSLEDLAKLCWQSGFDWVYYESTVKTGAHVHASVKRATSLSIPLSPATNSFYAATESGDE